MWEIQGDAHPTRILTVSGQVRMEDIVRTTLCTRPGRVAMALPIPLLQIESIGQPMLMSTKSTLQWLSMR